jgi:hypothetical protein
VTVTCGEEVKYGDRYVYIAIRNKGPAIGLDEIDKCKERNYRSAWAKRTTGEGRASGSG